MITTEDIRRALLNGSAQIVTNPETHHGAVCFVGGKWFPLAGKQAAETDTWNIFLTVPFEDIVEDVMARMEEFRVNEDPVYGYFESELTATGDGMDSIKSITRKFYVGITREEFVALMSARHGHAAPALC